MLIRYADWKKPTDDAYAFELRPLSAAAGTLLPLPAPTERELPSSRDIRDVVRHALGDVTAERFEARVKRWTGPEDKETSGEQPYRAQQLMFEEHAWSQSPSEILTRTDVERVLRGNVRVMRQGTRTDYLLRDHHMLDVVLYHYATTGQLPDSLFHADRHSDWCQDRYLEARTPDQAATWWRLLEGLKRPEAPKTPVLRESSVHFTTALAKRSERTEGRDIGAAMLVPGFVDKDALGWQQVLETPEALDCRWVSLDLDYFQPAAQLRLTGPMLRDARFTQLLNQAEVRVFVLSPQFNHGGDRLERWEIHGSVASSLRLVNWLRRA